MTVDIALLVSDNLDVWTTAVERRATSGRGGGGRRVDLYGIDRLRPLIVDLAVRGKLTSQEPDEEPAAAALARLAKARRSKIESGRAKKRNGLSPLPVDLPILPEGWAWTQLGTIAEISPSNIADDQLDASFVPMALVSTRIDGAHEAETRNWGEIKKGFTHFAEGDIGLAKITPCFENGKAAIFENLANGIGAGTTELHVARPWSEDVNRRYLLLTMKTASYLHDGELGMTGTAGQKRVTRTYFESSPLPFPPLAEQQRIVTKVDELMALCDALEGESAASIAAHEGLVEALLATLTASSDAADLAVNWTRLETHFDTLFTTESSVDALKQTILELAVRGKLVPQNADDAPASELLKAVKVQMADLSRRGRTKTPTEMVPIREGDLPFRAPEGWAFARFSEVLINRDAERVPISSDDRARRKGEFDYYGASGVIDHIDDYIFDEPLLLIGEDGANLVSRSTPIAFIAEGKYWVNNHAHVLQAISIPLLCYMEIFINAIDLKPYVTGTAQPKMNQAKMNSIVVAVPPANELERIVAKVGELNALCNALRSHIEESAATQRHLAAAVVERAAA
ncbi:restriction endonuclease subunit S [Mesorhizobium sp. B2-3-11]|uniref:restriction endonuclease subunit S n=1 Tax=Mesorhizobium sp. B2-3-11 TaxID=2589953 RepID=UPI00112E8959|nr:restriction endonuclease subunit S [Mesorhizobium sp. B2-3-11]TPL96423.1 restriction endonuclease subunit S [Mesorhizobium sp. B2-3-11]